ncbi:tRNA (adenosine(37)-N6)-threonylcarbamoyltransferase complex dimerization subunit type 1 TsaB [uncultured Sphingomonas sp.]|uniref:tRNA (adenosine(37)-N6)-threonylcarbamoyltransferase complex dimerization subunit type 1 TsaB n=1 Tax=uncultured Sphingomonas sp. TaxID=158754 RepID=UPI0025DAC50A|nr:tRNA (adenosine(37)-N6)-threonylcarbamoyltransferase complex dimerization subunit type 1 TsaB [uncultured Sphingomonas sp.]
MILAFDTSTAACTAALFAADGMLVASADEVIGRGHAERLVPMIAELLGARRPERVLVGCGPGSFTGLRVGIAAAHGMAIGWGAELAGFSSLALLAARSPGAGPIVAAVLGGHGELFLQEFGGSTRAAPGPLLNLPPGAAAAVVTAHQAIGPGASALVEARGWGEAIEALPTASHLLRLPAELRSLLPRPIYPRAPDARPKAA